VTETSSSDHPDELAGRLHRTETLHEHSSIPGRDIVQVRTEIPEGVASGWHTHPGEEVGYIVTGRVRMEVRDRTARVLNAGDGFLIPPGTPHNALDLGPGTGVMLSTYVVAPEEALSTFVS
jgi:quercetin dioxygenase-like cupin family protein